MYVLAPQRVHAWPWFTMRGAPFVMQTNLKNKIREQEGSRPRQERFTSHLLLTDDEIRALGSGPPAIPLFNYFKEK
jgi:hypothetical protein